MNAPIPNPCAEQTVQIMKKIVRDPRDARQDYYLQASLVGKLYKEGKLQFIPALMGYIFIYDPLRQRNAEEFVL